MAKHSGRIDSSVIVLALVVGITMITAIVALLIASPGSVALAIKWAITAFTVAVCCCWPRKGANNAFGTEVTGVH